MGKKSMHYIASAIGDYGGVFYFIGKRKYPVKYKKRNTKRRDGYQQAFAVFECFFYRGFSAAPGCYTIAPGIYSFAPLRFIAHILLALL
jgi:hypothetical protein